MTSHNETIRCPNCESVQVATVEHTVPWYTYVHTCTNCEYIILESEWGVVDEEELASMDLEDQFDLLYRGEAIRSLVDEVAATVTESNGFDGDEQAEQGCRKPQRIVESGVIVDGVTRVVCDQKWLSGAFQRVPSDAGWPAEMREDWIGD